MFISKFLKWVLVSVVVVMLTACGGSSNSSTDSLAILSDIENPIDDGGEVSRDENNIQEKSSVSVSPVSGNTASYNAIATFDVVLDQKPSSDVVIPISSSDENEGVLNVDKLTFTSENWNQAQMVVTKGRNNNVINGVQDYKIVLETIVSSDASYSGVDPDDVAMKGIYLVLKQSTDSTKFIAGLDSAIRMDTTYTGNETLSYSLLKKPTGMTINVDTGLVGWTPAQETEGNSYDVSVKVTDGLLSSEVNFSVSVAITTPLKIEIKENNVTITEQGSLNGLVVTVEDSSIEPQDIKFKSIPEDATRETPYYVTRVTDSFVVQEAVSGKLKVKLPLSQLPVGTDLHYVYLYRLTTNDHVEKAFWSPTLIGKSISNTSGEPVVEITLTGLSGVYFIGIEDSDDIEISSVQKTNKKVLSKIDLSTIECLPVAEDYMNQICTVNGNKITVYNFGESKTSTRWDGTTIEELIGYLMDAQEGFDKLKLKYANDFLVSIHAIRVDEDDKLVTDGSGEESSNFLGYVDSSEDRNTLHLTRLNKSKNDMQGTVVHEYFHHAQGYVDNKILNHELLLDIPVPWFTEGTARWFEDYILTPDSLEYDNLNTYISKESGLGNRILETGLNAVGEKGKYRPYQRFSFFKLLSSKCNKFDDIFLELLNVDISAGLAATDEVKQIESHLTNASCDFGNHLDFSKSSSLEAALLYYQYATLYERKISLLDANEDDDKFKFEVTPYEYSQSDMGEVGEVDSTGSIDISTIKSIPAYGAYSIKVNSDLFTYADLDENYEAVLRVRTRNSSNPLTISIISEHDKFIGNSKIDDKEHFHYQTYEKIEHIFQHDELIDYFITILNPNGSAVELAELLFEVRKKDSEDLYDLIANAGPDQTVTEDEIIILNGSNSQGADSYEWVLNGVIIEDGASIFTHVLGVGTHIITLNVTNDNGMSDSDEVIVTVVAREILDIVSPVFSSTNTVSVNENQTSAITLVATDTSTVAYSISGADASSFTVDSVTGVVTFASTPDYETKTSYTFTATARDEVGNEVSQNVTINILDIDETVPDTTAPVIIIQGLNPMTVIQGENYVDPGATATDDIDGAVSVTTTGNVDTSTVSTYIITYTAEDSTGNSSSKTRTVNVVEAANIPPTANAGADQTVILGEVVNLLGSNSTDSDGFIVSFDWSENGISIYDQADGGVNNLPVGQHTITLTVVDDKGAKDEDNITVTVQADVSVNSLENTVTQWEEDVNSTYVGGATYKHRYMLALYEDTSCRLVNLNMDIEKQNEDKKTLYNNTNKIYTPDTALEEVSSCAWSSSADLLTLSFYDGSQITNISLVGSVLNVGDVMDSECDSPDECKVTKIDSIATLEKDTISNHALEVFLEDGTVSTFNFREDNSIKIYSEGNSTAQFDGNWTMSDSYIDILDSEGTIVLRAGNWMYSTVDMIDFTSLKGYISDIETLAPLISASTQVKKTGQTTSYDGGGNEVTDGSIKDDGFYQTGVTPSYTRDDAKEVVTDHVSGLQWQDDAAAASVSKPWVTQDNYDAGNYNDTSGDTAATYCANLSLDGGGWRLPVRAELQAIVDYGRVSPAINPVFENVASDFYWSSTTNAGYAYSAWLVDFNDGFQDASSEKLHTRIYVRCVRAGQ